jgi:hypothetical protein
MSPVHMILTVISHFNFVVFYYEESNSHYSTNKLLLLPVSYDFIYIWTNSVNFISIAGPSPNIQEGISDSILSPLVR